MATSNRFATTTFAVTEDLSANGAKFHAVAFVDGKLANNGQEASGILDDKSTPENTQFATLIVRGESKFAAGAAVSAGDSLTVTTSGWFTTADSMQSHAVVGEAKYAVTSGSIGTGLFDFSTAIVDLTGIPLAVTAADAIGANMTYAIVDNKLANTPNDLSGVAPAAITSGSTGYIIVGGLVSATFADSYGPGQRLMAVTSGYMTAITSGYVGQATALEGATSGTAGTVVLHITELAVSA
jgi:hypothetical protein